jgi:hypothetical protein
MARSAKPEYAVLFALLLAACDTIPIPRVPQVEQATQAVEGGGERYRAHQACAKAAATIDGLLECMRDAGWDFVTRGPAYPEAGCWQARDGGELGRVTDLCFVRSPGKGRGAAP